MRERLIEAIHEQRLGVVADEVLAASGTTLPPGDLDLLRACKDACAGIRKQLRQEGRSLAARLEEAGIPCSFDEDGEDLRFPQFHRFAVEIGVEDPTAAVEVARQAGYQPELATDTPAWIFFRHRHRSMVLTRVDENTTRLELRWRAGVARSRLRLALEHPGAAVGEALSRARSFFGRSDSDAARGLGRFVGTPLALLPRLFAFAELDRDDVLLDVGSGDGRVLLEAAGLVGCRGIGVERDAELSGLAAKTVEAEGLGDRIDILHADVETAPVEDATVVFLFIPPRALARILPTIRARLRPGTRVVAHEQLPIEVDPPPDRREPLVGESCLTVGSLWTVR